MTQEEIDEVISQRDELYAACKWILKALEDKELIRDTSKDHEARYVFRAMNMVHNLSLIVAVVDRVEKGKKK